MLQAKSQHPKIWAGLASLVMVAAGIAGCGGGDPNAQDSAPIGSGGSGGIGSPQLPGASGSGTGGGTPGVGSGMQGMAGGMPAGQSQGQGAPMSGQANQQGQRTAALDPKLAPPKSRIDPFKPWFNTTPPPPSVLSLLEPVRIALTGTTAIENQPGVEIQEVPTRRVAGILTGSGVYALFDTGQVVKPGDMTDDGYRVVMINAGSVTLQRKVESQTFTQVVPLTDAGSTYTAAAAPMQRGGAGNRGGGFGPGFGAPGGPGTSGSSGPGGGASKAGS